MRSTCWPASRRASRCSARSRWRPPGRPASASSTPRSPPAGGWSWSGSCAATTTAYRAMKAALDRGRHRCPAAVPLRAPQPSVPPQRHHRRRHRRHLRARHRRRPLPARRRGRRRPGAQLRARTPGREHLQDPLLLLLEMANGVLVDVEAAVNIAYGYDIRGEVLGETGTIELAESSPIVVKREGGFGRPGAERLAGAVHPRLRHRVPGVDQRGRRRASRPARARGTATPPPWCATPACEAMESGERVEVSLREQPDLYRATAGTRHRPGRD